MRSAGVNDDTEEKENRPTLILNFLRPQKLGFEVRVHLQRLIYQFLYFKVLEEHIKIFNSTMKLPARVRP
jgi:hypothetical protein